jgi:hypothetical protein
MALHTKRCVRAGHTLVLMPLRISAHITDDKAVTAVQHALASAGMASEVVHKDYGEDLLVHASLDGSLSPSRFWIQVKGTTSASSKVLANGSTAVHLSVAHLVRWAQSADPVLLARPGAG